MALTAALLAPHSVRSPEVFLLSSRPMVSRAGSIPAAWTCQQYMALTADYIALIGTSQELVSCFLLGLAERLRQRTHNSC
jgi:hypothetical protein